MHLLELCAISQLSMLRTRNKWETDEEFEERTVDIDDEDDWVWGG